MFTSLLQLSLPQPLWTCQYWRLLEGNSNRIRRKKEDSVTQLGVPIFKKCKEDSTKNPQEILIALCLYWRVWSFPSRLLVCPQLFLARAGVSQRWVTTLSTGCVSSCGQNLLAAYCSVSCLSQAAFQGKYLPVIKGFASKRLCFSWKCWGVDPPLYSTAVPPWRGGLQIHSGLWTCLLLLSHPQLCC